MTNETSLTTRSPDQNVDAGPFDVFVTGGTGLIGRWLLARLSAEGRRVAALVRGGNVRRTTLANFIDSHGGDSTLVTLIDGDLGAEGPLVRPGPEWTDIRDVYHLAAAFAFGMKPERARSINVEGTRRVLEFAKRLPKLRRFVALGGYRATRLPSWFSRCALPFDGKRRGKVVQNFGGL